MAKTGKFNFLKDSLVQWKTHAGTVHMTMVGAVVGFLPMGYSAAVLAKKAKVKLNRDVSFGDTSTIDRFLVAIPDKTGTLKYYAPRASLLTAYQPTTATPPSSRKAPTRGQPVQEAPAKEKKAAAKRLSFGDEMPNASRYIFVGKSDALKVFARSTGSSLKFMVVGKGAENLTFVRKSNVHPAYTFQITGVAVQGDFGIVNDGCVYASEAKQFMDNMVANFKKSGIAISVPTLKTLFSLSDANAMPRNIIGIITRK